MINYNKTQWENGTTKLNATNMNNIENGIDSVANEVNEIDNRLEAIDNKISGNLARSIKINNEPKIDADSLGQINLPNIVKSVKVDSEPAQSGDVIISTANICKVEDIKVDGTSVLTNKVANISNKDNMKFLSTPSTDQLTVTYSTNAPVSEPAKEGSIWIVIE